MIALKAGWILTGLLWLALWLGACAGPREINGPAYSVDIMGVEDGALIDLLQASSQLIRLQDQPLETLGDLEQRAKVDLERLSKALRSEGYYAASLQYTIDQETKPPSVTLEIDPGPQYRLAEYEVNYQGAEPPTATGRPSLSELGLTISMPARAAEILAARQRLVTLLGKRGYPLAWVTDRKSFVQHDRQTMTVRLTVDVGPMAHSRELKEEYNHLGDSERALRIKEEALGPKHPDVVRDLKELAGLYYELAALIHAQGRYAEAEPLHRRALAIKESALLVGPKHPDVATSLNNLALLYEAQGRYGEAEAFYERALGIWEQALGPEHPKVAGSLNNLADLYRIQGRYAEAEPLHRRALAIKEKVLGPDHPEVAQSLSDLAELYYAQRRYGDAEPLYKRARAIRDKSLGPEHPNVAIRLNNLALLYQAQGHYAEAELLYQRALEILENTPGLAHPNVATSLENYASLLRETGRSEEAEEFEARAKAIGAKDAQNNPVE